MTAEEGHAASRVYRDQVGNFHLNGAAFYNDAEQDIADSLEQLNSLAPTEIGYLDGALPGTATASKTVIYDAAGRIVRNVAAPAAAGAAQATATALTADLNAVTGADGAKGVALPAAAAGGNILVINTDPSSALLVYPFNGGNDAINGLGANNAFTLAANEGALFIATSATQWYTPGIAGLSTIARSKLIEDALQVYGIPIARLMAPDGSGLVAAESAGTFNVSVAANVISAQGEITDNETEVSVCEFQFVLPPEYVAAGDVKVRIPCALIKTGAAVNDGSTIDVSAFEQSDAGAVGADLCETAAQTFAADDTWYNKDFVITASGLVAGDVLNVVVTASVIDSEAGAGTLRLNMASPKMLIDVKG